MSPEPFTPLPPTAAATIATYHPGPPAHHPIEEAQAAHRINLLNAWAAIPPGARVLEVGCGQGTCTAVLAEAVGPRGRVDALDPAPPTYGAPYTLAQAQAHVSASPVGPRIAWHRAAPEAFLAQARAGEGEGETWDAAVLAHCIWYFSGGEAALRGVLSALRGRARRVCVAEYSMGAGAPAAAPHVLAAVARGVLESHKAESKENICAVLAPDAIRAAAAACGWAVEREAELVPAEGLLDGSWETGTVVSPRFLEEVDGVGDARVRSLLRSAREATIRATEAVGGVKKVRTMDVWAAVLVPDGSA